MRAGVFRRSGWLRALRADAAGIARLLLLAFVLQLSLPLSGPGTAALAGEAALRADLQSSLCHDQGSAAQPDGLPADDGPAKHCVFCLSMAGDPATAGQAPQSPVPPSARTEATFAPADQAPAATRPAHARSRAPPAAPRTV